MFGEHKLTKEERSDAKRRLQEWQSPDEMAHFVSTINNQIGSVHFISGHGLKFLQEAFIAAAFGRARLADKVRLCVQDPPDFELNMKGHTLAFEATEADDPKRRRGDEYKAAAAEIRRNGFSIEEVPDEYEGVSSEHVFDCLHVATKRKAEKLCGKKVTYSLVVYLNLGECDASRREILAVMRAATEVAGASFEEVWVLWQRRVYRFWSGQSEIDASGSAAT